MYILLFLPFYLIFTINLSIFINSDLFVDIFLTKKNKDRLYNSLKRYL